MSSLAIIGLIIVGALIVGAIYIYNRLVKLSIKIDQAESDTTVQLKRRHNLIPNLVETVKGYAGHEKETLTNVVEARQQAISAKAGKESQKAENILEGALKSLFAISEAYPDLKANQNFLLLQKELVDAEDKIQAARRFYNSTVNRYNSFVKAWPMIWIAPLFGYQYKDVLFAVTDASTLQNPDVKF